MKKKDLEDLFIPKQNSLENSLKPNDCIDQYGDHKELRKDKKYITKVDSVLCYHDKISPLNLLIVVTFREKNCIGHIIEIHQYKRFFNKYKYFIRNIFFIGL